MEISGLRNENNSVTSSPKISGRLLHHGGHSSGKDVDGLFKALNMSHCSEAWRLFIDSSKVSFKDVLLHNGNVLPSIPVAH